MNFVLPAVAPAATTAIVLAQQPDSGNNGGQGQDFGKSSPVGFLLLLIFLIAVAFLVRSMTKHLKRVPKTFDPDSEVSEATPDEEGGDQAEGAATEKRPEKQPEKSESS